jgi:hypothetical protein
MTLRRPHPLIRPLRAFLAVSLGLMLPALFAEGANAAKQKVEKADDLPRHTYAVTEAPSRLLNDATAFKALAAAVRRDMAADLLAYDIKDRTTLQNFVGLELSLAMLDDDYAGTLAKVAELKGLQDKPSAKLSTGLTSAAWAQTHLAGAEGPAFAPAFQAALARAAQALPWDLVQNDLKSAKAGFEIRSPSLLVGMVQQEIDPSAAKTGTISATMAQTLIVLRNQIVNLLPYKREIVTAFGTVIASHNVAKPDRWTERLVTLTPADHGHPVRIGIWDSGVDLALYPDHAFTDEAGHHGFAYTLHDDPTPDLIYPLGAAQARADALLGRMKGFSDLQAAIDSPEATDLKRYMSGLKPEQVKPTLEDLGMTGDWVHGTHVAGIAVAGNPYAQLVVGRITFDYHLIPEVPTLEQAHKDAAMYQSAVAYFKAHGVRVVNMSWGGSLKDYESALEANGAGGDAEARKKLARQLFNLSTAGLLQALKDAPGILFVVAAGNSNDDVKFDEFVPSSFQLPNMITVGAVDQAGDETSFSAFGPTVNVHANGFEVESYVPGGRKLKLSGTSMASPEVTNLAAKLFALDPALTPVEAKRLILAGCDRSGRVNLISEVNSIALLRTQLAKR